jgi:hypothetical protein
MVVELNNVVPRSRRAANIGKPEMLAHSNIKKGCIVPTPSSTGSEPMTSKPLGAAHDSRMKSQESPEPS